MRPRPRVAGVGRRIALLDFRLLFADRVLVLLSVLFVLFVAYATSHGTSWARGRAEQVSTLQRESAAELSTAAQQLREIEAGRLVPGAVPFAGWVFTANLPAVMPPAPLAPLSIGQADVHPFATTINLYTTKSGLFKNYEMDNPTKLLAGRFDLAFVIVYLYPLLIITLTYNLLSQEREDGTLALSLSQPVCLWHVVAGKVAARLLFVLSLGVGVSLVSLALAGVDVANGTVAARFGWLALLVSAHALLWFSVAVWVNASGRSSTANATVLVGLWLLVVIVIPGMVSIVVGSTYPAPSRLELVQQLRRQENAAGRLGRKVMDEYQQEHSGTLAHPATPNWEDLQSRFVYSQTANERRTLPLTRAYDAQLAQQQAVVDRWRFLSSAVLLQDALDRLAGTDRSRAQEFQRQVEAFVDRWRLYAIPRSFRGIHLRPVDYDSLPRFTFVEPYGSDTSRMLAALVALLLPTVFFGWLGVRRLSRYALV